ncbi:MAG: L-histidine N(alpha)-methyltransferase [Gammaproteobacteria bacterium]
MKPTVHAFERRDAAASANDADFAGALHTALAVRPRRISPKYFYDAAGAELFDRICELPEYYPTRTEIALLDAHADEMAAAIGPRADVIEFGAGSMQKIRILLRALRDPVRYVPVDISTSHLHRHAELLREDFPGLEVSPLAADFSRRLTLPAALHKARRRIGFFPGSSIGNFTPDEARQFLSAAARTLQGGGLLIGVDLVKDPGVLHAAYNDAAGVTAAFNRNLLVRANRELATDFDPSAFDHYAFFNPNESRIEMHLLCRERQVVHLGPAQYTLEPGDALHTENSYKYTLDRFRSLAHQAGFEPREVWCDAQRWFSVHWLVVP